jgi:flagellar biosynthesis/type III secretory pathway M-ring protein FliF/YscJ
MAANPNNQAQDMEDKKLEPESENHGTQFALVVALLIAVPILLLLVVVIALRTQKRRNAKGLRMSSAERQEFVEMEARLALLMAQKQAVRKWQDKMVSGTENNTPVRSRRRGTRRNAPDSTAKLETL